MKANEKRDLLVAGVAVGLVALWAMTQKSAAAGTYSHVVVSSGMSELASSPSGQYAFALPSGGRFVSATLSSTAGVQTLLPASDGLLYVGAPSASLVTLVWTLNGTQWTSVYTVQ
jgi:Mn2+/Fe2+ NRAMP family transporter